MLSIIVPIAIVFIIISYSLIKKLNKAPIEILNSDKDEKKKGKGQVRYGKNFINDYRIREIKENKGNLCIFVVSSLLISVLLVFSFTLKYTVDEYMKALNVETKYNNLYVFDKLQSSKDKESTFEEFLSDKSNICTTKAEVISSGKAIVKVINSIVSILICFSIFISIIVLYLICKYNIDRNSINISLLKVLGYSDSEINTMYEKWNELVISCVFILSIPIGVLLVGIFFVGIVGNLNNYIDTKVSITYCVLCFVLIISGYIVSSKLIKNSISKIEMSKILKDGKE
ncbi:MAG: FtsX-like permease family protein [Clostridium sp.]|nr:FtsX-like permease family protein [Clostridium sp.]